MIELNNTHTFKYYTFTNSSTPTFNFYQLNGAGIARRSTYQVYTTSAGVSYQKNLNWLLALRADDTVNVSVYQGAGWSSATVFNPNLVSASSCESGCSGIDWIERTPILGGGCMEEPTLNDTVRCPLVIPSPPVPPTPFGNVSFVEPFSFLNQSSMISGGFAWTLPLLTPFFVLTILMLAIAGFLAFLTKSAEVAVGSLLLLMMAFTFLGIYPIWIGIIFSIIAGLILAKMMGIIGGG
jgi:hypothetical protein